MEVTHRSQSEGSLSLSPKIQINYFSNITVNITRFAVCGLISLLHIVESNSYPSQSLCVFQEGDNQQR